VDEAAKGGLPADCMTSYTDVFLSAAECFVIGRIAAAWPVECRKFEAMKEFGRIQESLLRVLNRVFDEFGLERSGLPKEWWDRQDDLPDDVVWRKTLEREPPTGYMSTDEGFPGTPCVAMGVSPSEQIEPPRSGLYGLLLRRLRPIMGQACGTVDHELWRFAEMAGCRPLIWTTLRRVREPSPEDTIPALLGALQVFQRPEAEAAARADHLVAAVYRDAARELAEYAGDVSELLMITMGIMLAHSRTSQASMYLYGKFHGSAQ